jgi:hypothetical protein
MGNTNRFGIKKERRVENTPPFAHLLEKWANCFGLPRGRRSAAPGKDAYSPDLRGMRLPRKVRQCRPNYGD